MVSHFLLPGTIFVSKDQAEITTILGSCVAICLWDPVSRIGGMNHYLLPLWNGEGIPTPKYGNVAIPKLIQKMLEMGANAQSLQAKVFGGAAVLETVGQRSSILNVGQRNIEIAFEELEKNRIKIVSYDVGGELGRKIIMFTDSFEIKLKRINKTKN
ncbi:MAG: chemotaxis protein CheD [Calditerrivibrio sp.]|nr:chemotaxis protein CheD [Calditerrivibrio sp.]